MKRELKGPLAQHSPTKSIKAAAQIPMKRELKVDKKRQLHF